MNIVHCFGAPEVAVAAHRVVVVMLIRFPFKCFFHIAVPHLGILAVLGSEVDGVDNVSNAAIIGSQHKSKSLLMVGHSFREIFFQFCKFPHCGFHAHFRVAEFGSVETVASCCGGHDLHNALCACPRHHIGVEARFHPRYGGK